jgi:hypothetical protein
LDSSGLSILVAAVPGAAGRLRDILAGHRVLCPATYAKATLALSREQFALAVFGVYFDESRMFELLSYARASAKNCSTPVVCVLGIRGRLSDPVIRCLEQTISSMPLTTFLNLAAIPDDRAGNAVVRGFLEGQLLAQPASSDAPPQDRAVT